MPSFGENNISSKKILYFALAFGVLIGIIQIFIPNLVIIGGLIGLGIFILSFYSLPHALYLVVALAFIIPEGAGMYKYFSFEIAGFSIRFLEILLGILILSWLAQLIRGKYRFSLGKYKIGIVILFLFVWLGLSVYVGFSRGALTENIANDVRKLLYFATFFITISCITKKEQIKNSFYTIVASAVAFSAIFIGMYYFRSFVIYWLGLEFPGMAGAMRFNFRNTSGFFIPFALLGALFMYSKERTKRIFYYGIPLILLIFVSALTETRTLWFALGATAFVLIAIFLIRKKINIKGILIAILVLVVLSLIIIRIPQVRRSDAYLRLQERVGTITEITQDPSLRFRMDLTKQVWYKIRQHPYLGWGAGIPIKFAYRGVLGEMPYFDNSFLTLAYKTGLFGLVIYLVIFSMFVVNLIKAIRKSKGLLLFCELAILASIPAFIFWGLSTVMWVDYQIILIFGFIFALVEILSKEKFEDVKK